MAAILLVHRDRGGGINLAACAFLYFLRGIVNERFRCFAGGRHLSDGSRSRFRESEVACLDETALAVQCDLRLAVLHLSCHFDSGI